MSRSSRTARFVAHVLVSLPDAVQIAGHIRIRSKTQGIALSLGDKITLNLKETQSAGSGEAEEEAIEQAE